MLTRIHINQHNIRHNTTHPIRDRRPVVTAKDYKQNRKGNEAVVLDADGNVVCRVVYRPDAPLPCGAKCWVETNLDVEVF